jgi:hypothetical protein
MTNRAKAMPATNQRQKFLLATGARNVNLCASE